MTDKRSSTATDNASIKVAGGNDIAAGVALGLFIGALVGLSVMSGITSTVLTPLIAVLAIFFGLTDTVGTTKIKPASGRITAFCIAALIATTVGIYARTHNLLSPPGSYLSDVAKELRGLGYKDDEIHAMIKTKYFGVSESLPVQSVRRDTDTTVTFPKPAKQ
jgi:hypothetical protein